MKYVCLLTITLIICSCAGPKHRPYFFSDAEDVREKQAAISHLRVKVDDVIDNIDHDLSPAQAIGPKIYTSSGRKCVNTTKRYHKRYWSELSKITNIYLKRFLGVGRVSQIIEEYDYRISVSVADMWMVQDYPDVQSDTSGVKPLAVPAGGLVKHLQFVGIGIGAVSALASAMREEEYYTSEGELSIVLDSINIYDNKGFLVHSLLDSKLTLEQELFLADEDCRCTFYNLDYAYKQLLMAIAPEIERQLAAAESRE